MDPTSVILHFYTIDGNKTEQTITHYAPFHQLGPFAPATIQLVEVGAYVSVYGNILTHHQGAHIQKYIHLRKGQHKMEPFQWLTFHADLLN